MKFSGRTLEEAKEWLRGKFAKGADCPCCGQFVKLYRRKLNSSMAYAMILLAKHQKEIGGAWFHVPDYLSSVTSTATIRGGDWSKLRYWGLIESDESIRDDGSKRAGVWRVTEAGMAFAANDKSVPSHVHIYNGEAFSSYQTGETTNIEQALGEKFNYRELMRATP